MALLELKYARSALRESLATDLWEGPQALRNLRQLLFVIRQWELNTGLQLLEVQRDRIQLVSGEVRTDLAQFLRIDEVGTWTALGNLAHLYQGELLRGVTIPGGGLSQWVEQQRAALDRRFLAIALQGVSRVSGPMAEQMLLALMIDRPLDEEVHRSAISYYARLGLPKKAREVFDVLSGRLREELSADPELETVQLLAETVGAVPPARVGRGPERNEPAPSRGVPRVLILPPTSGSYELVPHNQLVLGVSLVDDIITSLCRMRSFAVLAPHTARLIADARAPQLFANISADYIVNTRITPDTGAGFRLGVSLTRVSTSQVLMGDELRFTPAQLISRRSELIEAVTRQVSGHIERVEIGDYRATGAASAYVHYLLGTEDLQRLELKRVRSARAHFKRALQLSPDLAPAMSMMARALCVEWVRLDRTDELDLVHEAYRLAGQAIARDPFDPLGHRELGHALIYMGDLDQAIEHLDRAVERGPHHADILLNYADALVHASQSLQHARRLVETAFSLNPLAPDLYFWIGATVDFFIGDFSDALTKLLRMKEPSPAARLIAACAAMAGEEELAHRYRDAFLDSHPDFRIADWKVPLRGVAQGILYRDALRRAGFT